MNVKRLRPASMPIHEKHKINMIISGLTSFLMGRSVKESFILNFGTATRITLNL